MSAAAETAALTRVVTGRPQGPTYYVYYPSTAGQLLGFFQMFCGLIWLITLPLAAIERMNYVWQALLFASVWTCTAGFVCIYAGKLKTSFMVATGLVLSIGAVVAAAICIVVSIMYFIAPLEIRASKRNVQPCVTPSIGKLTTTQEPLFNDQPDEKHDFIAGLTAFVAIVELALAIGSSVIACQFVCICFEKSCCQNCCCKYDITTSQKMILIDLPDDQCERELLQTLAPRPFQAAVAMEWMTNSQQQQQQQQEPLRPAVSSLQRSAADRAPVYDNC